MLYKTFKKYKYADRKFDSFQLLIMFFALLFLFLLTIFIIKIIIIILNNWSSFINSNEFKLFDRNILKPEIIDIYLDKNEKLFNDNEIVKDENWLKWADKKEKEWFGKDYYFKKNDEFCKKDDKCNNGPNIKQMEVEF